MLTSCPTGLAETDLISAAAQFGPEVDPISRSCPDNLPCQVQDAELWFAETPAELERAKQFCQDCPARLACLSGALDRREPWGVWGGEIFERGSIVARKRPRGRPRKADREVAA
jgi:WhiB family redox-sensing transcriptional regulator